MTIDWANGKIPINAPHLQHLLKTLREHMAIFESINFHHIYRELNSDADNLFKMALALPPGIMEVKEIVKNQTVNQYVCKVFWVTKDFFDDQRSPQCKKFLWDFDVL